MKPLVVLIIIFVIAEFIMRLVSKHFDHSMAARIAMSGMLLFTAMGHFAFAKGMAMMIPPPVPFKMPIVYLTGIFEIIAAVGLLFNSFDRITSYALILFFILMFPANIYAAQKNVDYQKDSYDGPGIRYLWFRVPLQLLFIAWVYFSAVL